MGPACCGPELVGWQSLRGGVEKRLATLLKHSTGASAWHLTSVPPMWQPETPDMIHLRVQMGIELFLVEMVQ